MLISIILISINVPIVLTKSKRLSDWNEGMERMNKTKIQPYTVYNRDN